MSDRIQLRRDTVSNWASVNPALAQGEPGYELGTDLLKFGDGLPLGMICPTSVRGRIYGIG